MIEISGELSQKTKKFYFKESLYVFLISFLVISVVLLTTITFIIKSANITNILWIIYLVWFLLFLVIVVPGCAFWEFAVRDSLPIKIIIEDDGLIECHYRQSNVLMFDQQDIYEVQKNKNAYIVVIKFPRKHKFIIERILITEEICVDIEKIFQDKLVVIDN